MTDSATAPVRVPNVRPGARSGLSGEVIGSDAITAHEENQRLAADGQPITGQEGENPSGTEAVNAETGVVSTAGLLPPIEGQEGTVLAPPIPEDATTVDALLAWVEEAEDSDQKVARAEVVLDAERERAEDDQRKTLVEPLEAFLEQVDPSTQDGEKPSE